MHIKYLKNTLPLCISFRSQIQLFHYLWMNIDYVCLTWARQYLLIILKLRIHQIILAYVWGGCATYSKLIEFKHFELVNSLNLLFFFFSKIKVLWSRLMMSLFLSQIGWKIVFNILFWILFRKKTFFAKQRRFFFVFPFKFTVFTVSFYFKFQLNSFLNIFLFKFQNWFLLEFFFSFKNV